ncbi:MAG: BCCT family transporter, partial [Erysipelotrichaceae bacterium]|nr:BCCT family transporter [Erysipelotrichaceae bacterium]
MDWFSIIVPLFSVVALCIFFALRPQESQDLLMRIRYIVGDRFSLYYAVLGLGMFIFTMYLGLSRYGKLRFGNLEKPQYANCQWGAL